jgi:cytidylate kinase
MKIFGKFARDKEVTNSDTTVNFFLGAPEAEAESIMSSRMHLNDVFEDFLDVFPQLETEKFIITGRKGCGKSAIAEQLHFETSKNANFFCDFIKKSDIDIEKISQIAKEHDNEISQELLIEWIILIKFTNQLIENQLLENQKEISDLKVFLKKNSGFVDIKSNQINEVINSGGYEVQTEYFKRFLTAKYGNKYDIKSSKAPFYKLIPHLKQTVKDLFQNHLNKNNEYVLIFDDLDIGFNSKNTENINSLLNIIRVVKDYNITFFGKHAINAKIILLLRDDISNCLLNVDADPAKTFSSYEIVLKWYEYNNSKKNEDNLKIKQFINKRIKLNFEHNNISFDESKPWESLIQDDESYSVSSFKYVIDHTLIRPRDLLLFFKPLSEFKFQIPLKKQDINTLIGKYSIEFAKEIRNELAAHYKPSDIDSIFSAFNNCVNDNVTYKIFIYELDKYQFSEDKDKLLSLLFDLSIIGNVIDGSKTYFKHWEQDDEIFNFNKDYKIVVHFSLRNYCQRKRTY